MREGGRRQLLRAPGLVVLGFCHSLPVVRRILQEQFSSGAYRRTKRFVFRTQYRPKISLAFVRSRIFGGFRSASSLFDEDQQQSLGRRRPASSQREVVTTRTNNHTAAATVTLYLPYNIPDLPYYNTVITQPCLDRKSTRLNSSHLA